MRRLLVITQKVDINDDLLGSFVGWLEEFAKHFDRVEVITLFKGDYHLPSNVFVHSLGKEKSNSRLSRVFNFYKLLFRLAPCSVGVFAHMSPVFAVAAWPAAAIFRKKIVLWYLHRSVTARLKLAERICYKIVTASRNSLKFQSNKIVELGHGIDLEYFKPSEQEKNGGPLKILSVGRISPIKNYETILSTAKILKEQGINFHWKVIGQPIMPLDFSYFEKLKTMRSELKLENEVDFVGFVPYSQILSRYQAADILVNPLPSGGLDRAVLEAMATGVLVLTSNDVFGDYFGPLKDNLLFCHNDAADLASKALALSQWSPEKKEEALIYLRKVVEESHNKKNLIANVVKLFHPARVTLAG